MKEHLIAAIECLNQGKTLLQSITSEDYSSPCELLEVHTIGAHMRHNLDHFDCFISGLTSREINYDARERDLRTETSTTFAVEKIENIQKSLQQIPENTLNASVKVLQGTSTDQESQDKNTASTLIREIQFLVSHTIHHYAIIAILCKLKGIEVHPTFGVAPSTLDYRKSQAACAR